MSDWAVVAVVVVPTVAWVTLGMYVARRMLVIASIQDDNAEPSEDLAGAGGFIDGGDDGEDDELEHGESYAPTCNPRKLGFR